MDSDWERLGPDSIATESQYGVENDRSPNIHLQQTVRNVTAEHIGFEEGILRKRDVETTFEIENSRGAKYEVDVEDEANTEARETDSDRAVGSKEVDGIHSIGADIDIEVDISLDTTEIEPDHWLDDILGCEFGSDSAPGPALSADDGQTDRLGVVFTSLGPCALEEDLIMPLAVERKVCRDPLLNIGIASDFEGISDDDVIERSQQMGVDRCRGSCGPTREKQAKQAIGA